MKIPISLEDLTESLRCLPGVGPKSAQRMAYHLLQRDHIGAQRLANALTQALEHIKHCEMCNNFTEEAVCGFHRYLCRCVKAFSRHGRSQ